MKSLEWIYAYNIFFFHYLYIVYIYLIVYFYLWDITEINTHQK